MLNLKLFTNRVYVGASLVAFIFGAGIYGSTFLIPLFAQTIQGYTPTRSGLLLMPAGLILALVFIRAFGLGPLPGVLAIAVGEIGVLAKLYAEAIENISKKPVEGVVASGGSRSQAIRFGMLPQVWPVLLSITLYNFESNVRSGTILGIVGAGGIGFILSDRIGAYRWDEAWSIIFLIIAMVYVIDALSGAIRERFIGKWEHAK
jgi:phosphonate transport system permease protein